MDPGVADKRPWWRAPWPNQWLRVGAAVLAPFSAALTSQLVRGTDTDGPDPALVAVVVISAIAVAIGIAVWLRDRDDR